VRRLPGEIVLNVALLRFRAISQLILAQNIFLSISLRPSFCKRLFIKILRQKAHTGYVHSFPQQEPEQHISLYHLQIPHFK
jgi:hypothetical protein